MTRSRKIFRIGAAVLAAFLIFIIIDISRRTTFPGSKKKDQTPAADTSKNHSSPKKATRQP